MATKPEIKLSEVADALANAVRNNLVAVKSPKTGNQYFEVKPFDYEACGMIGQFKAAWVYLKDATLTQAASAERRDDIVNKSFKTPAEKKAWLEAQLKAL